MAAVIISYDEAVKKKRRYYLSDRPCEFGHPPERAVADDSCKTCNLLKFRRDYYSTRKRDKPPKPESKEQKLRRLNAEHVAWIKGMTAR
jgi:hypothetical protein